jgi:hypothetical protein
MFNVNNCRHKPKTNKTLTVEEFELLVKQLWDLMIAPEFPEESIYKIILLNNNSFASWADSDECEFGFGMHLCYGVYKLWFVEDVIKHEIGHVLDYLRNGSQYRTKETKRGNVQDMHGRYFRGIADEFDFDPISNVTDERLKYMEVYAI